MLPSLRSCVPVLAAVLALSACSSSDSPHNDAAATSGFPVTVSNCGVEVTLDAAPERIVTVKSTTYELLLALGAGDRIVGRAFLDGPVPADLADVEPDDATTFEKVPGQEAVLDLEPDLVHAGWESNVTAEGAGDRETLASLGVATYVSPSACQSADVPGKLTFADVWAEITQVGAVVGEPAAAAALVADLQERLAAVEPDHRGLSALWFSSGSDTPFVGAGRGAPQMILEAAGLSNIAADVDAAWSPLSWEAVVDADPDVIVLVDSAWGSTEKKIGVLESNPATAQLDAVKHGRYLVVPFAAGEAGLRNVEAVETILAGLADLEELR